MKIVVLDGYTLNPGDLSWEGLQALGDVTIHDRTPPALTVERSAGAEVLLTNKTVLDRPALDRLPDLKYVGVLATGYNVVDLQAARERTVVVTNVPAYSTTSVAQTVFAHLLEHTHNVRAHTESVKKGEWSGCEDFCYWLSPPLELAGLTMGIVGFGRIGRQVARIAVAFGMRVLAYDAQQQRDLPEGCEMAELDRVFAESDAVTCHCPLTPETQHLVNAERLSTMKKTAILINTSRGPVVDESALAAALRSGTIAGAGVDVMGAEPPPADSQLIAAPNCTITPHIAWASGAARARLMSTAVGNLEAFLAGKPRNVVS
jgi:glycerate dehydrogenase